MRSDLKVLSELLEDVGEERRRYRRLLMQAEAGEGQEQEDTNRRIAHLHGVCAGLELVRDLMLCKSNAVLQDIAGMDEKENDGM